MSTQSESNLLAAVKSVESEVFRYCQNISAAYNELCNAQTLIDARTMLAQVHFCAVDLEKLLQRILYKWGCPPSQVRDVRSRTQDTLEGKMLNMIHYYNRFLMSRPKHKAKNLTSLYYLIQDVAAISLTTKPDGYQRERQS